MKRLSLPWVPSLWPALLVVVACQGPKAATFGSGYERVEARPEVLRMEHQMWERLNADRKAQGLAPLGYDETLADIARAHSADMVTHHFFEHESPQTGTLENRLDRAGYLFVNARENLAEAADPMAAQDALLLSPHHYENIMATDIEVVGIGIVPQGIELHSNLTVTQVFARPRQLETETVLAQRIVERIALSRRQAGRSPASELELLSRIAKEHVASYAKTEDSLSSVAAQIQERILSEPSSGLKGVLIVGQILPSSEQFVPPEKLANHASVVFGLATLARRSAQGRPETAVLLLIGIR